MAELVDAADLKSVEGNSSWEFKSPYPHFLAWLTTGGFCNFKHNFAVLEALCLKLSLADLCLKNDVMVTCLQQ